MARFFAYLPPFISQILDFICSKDLIFISIYFEWRDTENRRNILCFHSRGQHLCKFIGTKESVYIRKEFNSHRTGLGHKHGRRLIVWDTNMAAMTSCENTQSEKTVYCTTHTHILCKVSCFY